MSGRLREACQTVSRVGISASHLPDVSALKSLTLTLDARPTGAHRFESVDPVVLANEISSAVRRGEPLTRRQLRQVPWCLWSPGTALANQPDLLAPILEAIASGERAGPFRTLATVYLDEFDPSAPGMEAAASCLVALSAKWQGHWQNLQNEFQLFDLEFGPQQLAAAVLAEDKSATEILRERGVQAMAAQGGYVRAVTAALLDRLAQDGGNDHRTRLDKIRRYAMTENGSARFQDQTVNIIEALLRPFEREKPERSIRDVFLETILSLLGDPRLKPGRWTPIPTELKDLVVGWLTEQSLHQFLDIVEQTTERLDMFMYRRAFWQAAFDAGFVNDVWVAFGSKGSALARRSFGKEVSFAELFPQRKPVDPGHAVMLMRVGHGLIADWSHMGMCNIWLDSNDPTAPKLFELRYGSNEVQVSKEYGSTSRDAFKHDNPSGYTWQRKAAEHLYRMTGRRLPPESYRVT